MTRSPRRWWAWLLAGAAAMLGPGAAQAAAAHPLGEWRFNEPSGDVARDLGPFGLDGRLGDTAGPDFGDPDRIDGLSGGALRFRGQQLVRLPSAPELAAQTLSIDAVVRAPESPGQWRYIVSRGSFQCFAGSYGLYTGAAGGIALYVFDGHRYVVSATARPQDIWDGAWHHVAATFDGDALRLYLDGRPVGVPTSVPLAIDYAGTTTDAAFGRYVGDCNLSYRGDLDLVRIWSGAMSHQAIAEAAGRELGRQPATDPLPSAEGPALVEAPLPTTPPPTAAPGAPDRACALRISRRRIVARKRTSLRVRVTVRGRPARKVRVVARRNAGRKPITAKRTGRRGRARLVLHVRRPGRVRISAAVRPMCVPRIVRVVRAS